jgi:hypothetical protein
LSYSTLFLSFSQHRQFSLTAYICYVLKNIRMKSNTLKSIGAVLAGLVFIGVTHSVIDAILESVGILPKGNLYVSTSLILFVVFYRAVFSLLGCYLTAKLAPQNPMKHALILGGIGTLLSATGAIVTADMNLGPAWYAWTLVAIALPVAWLGGKLYMLRNPSVKSQIA